MLIVFSITPVFAEENHTVSVINTVGLGNVHIAINQYDIVDNQKVSIAENPTVLPGQKFDRVCEITNLELKLFFQMIPQMLMMIF